MRGQKTAFILDFDNVLFDTESLKKAWVKILKENKISNAKFIKAYKKSKSRSGYLEIKKLVKYLNIDRRLLMTLPFENFVFPQVIENLEYLKTVGLVLLISVGDNYFQPKKINKSGIAEIIGKNNCRITINKKIALKKAINRLEKLKYKNIIVIDDMAQNLVDAKNISSSLTTIWVRYGKYKNNQPTTQLSVTYKTKSFVESVRYIVKNKLVIIKNCKS